MNVEQILKSLRDERDALEQAILSLERLGAGQGRRRGRPPAWMKRVEEHFVEAPKRRGRPPGSKNNKARANAAH